jgi:hypothetical protein
VDLFSGLFSAFGLSASAGLNAYIPLLVVSLLAKFYPDVLELAAPWDAMTSWWVIGVLIVLSIVEFVADKVPAVNHVNDVIQSFIRPAAGAILFVSNSAVVEEIHPVLAIIAGLLVAGGVHVGKSAMLRPTVTATTGGAGTPAVSLAEDIIAALISILAVVIPVIIAAIIIVVTSTFVWWLWRRSNLRA